MATKLLSRAAIFAAPLPTKEVEVPEWGGTVKVSALTGITRMTLLDAVVTNEREVEDYEADQALDEGERTGVAKAERYDHLILRLIWSIVDDSGKPLFTLEDHEALKKLSYPTISYLHQEIVALEHRSDYDTVKKTSN